MTCMICEYQVQQPRWYLLEMWLVLVSYKGKYLQHALEYLTCLHFNIIFINHNHYTPNDRKYFKTHYLSPTNTISIISYIRLKSSPLWKLLHHTLANINWTIHQVVLYANRILPLRYVIKPPSCLCLSLRHCYRERSCFIILTKYIHCDWMIYHWMKIISVFRQCLN